MSANRGKCLGKPGKERRAEALHLASFRVQAELCRGLLRRRTKRARSQILFSPAPRTSASSAVSLPTTSTYPVCLAPPPRSQMGTRLRVDGAKAPRPERACGEREGWSDLRPYQSGQNSRRHASSGGRGRALWCRFQPAVDGSASCAMTGQNPTKSDQNEKRRSTKDGASWNEGARRQGCRPGAGSKLLLPFSCETLELIRLNRTKTMSPRQSPNAQPRAAAQSAIRNLQSAIPLIRPDPTRSVIHGVQFASRSPNAAFPIMAIDRNPDVNIILSKRGTTAVKPRGVWTQPFLHGLPPQNMGLRKGLPN